MALFNKRDLLERGGITNFSVASDRVIKACAANESLKKEAAEFRAWKEYDVFLSHSYDDAILIKALRDALVAFGYSVYVDWIEDRQLDRSKVTKETAGLLRERMKTCKSLLYATSEGAARSLWMPWELGYFDAFKGRVAVAPIAESAGQVPDFHRREYLGLYPYVDATDSTVWANEDGNFISLRDWINGKSLKKT